MALEFSDSIGHYLSASRKYDMVTLGTNGGDMYVIAGSGRNGRNCLFMKYGRLGAYNYATYARKNLTNKQTRFFSFAFYLDPQSPNTDMAIFQVRDNATTQIDVRVRVSGAAYLTRNGTQVGSDTAGTVSFGEWHYAQLKVKVDPANGVAELRIDNDPNLVITFTGNSQASGNNYSNNFTLLCGTASGQNDGAYMRFADVVINDDQGDAPIDFPGDCAVLCRLPSGNGTVSDFSENVASWAASTVYAVGTTILDPNSNLQRVTSVTGDAKSGASPPTWNTTPGGTTTDNNVTWTNQGAQSAYKLINEVPADDGSSYLSNATVGEKQGFTVDPITGSEVKGVVIWIRAQKDDAGSRAVQVGALSGVTEGYNGSDIDLTSSWAYQMGVLPKDPATGSGWLVEGVNGAEWRIKTRV